jgi:hypothetical protein
MRPAVSARICCTSLPEAVFFLRKEQHTIHTLLQTTKHSTHPQHNVLALSLSLSRDGFPDEWQVTTGSPCEVDERKVLRSSSFCSSPSYDEPVVSHAHSFLPQPIPHVTACEAVGTDRQEPSTSLQSPQLTDDALACCFVATCPFSFFRSFFLPGHPAAPASRQELGNECTTGGIWRG